MPRKNKEEYNEYMRNYMKQKYKKNTGKPPMDGDFNGTEAPVLDLNGDTTKQLMQIGKEVFKDPETGKPDKILTYIEQGAKYLPLVIKFIQGFSGSMQAFQQQQPQQVQQSRVEAPKRQPPDGWEHFNALEKMKYKYSRPAWYQAGLSWDSYKQSGGLNPSINVDYVDPSYTQPRRGQPIVHEQAEPLTLKDLSRKHAEPPLVDDSPSERPKPVQDAQKRHDPKLEAVIKEKQQRHLGKDYNEKKTDKTNKKKTEQVSELVTEHKELVSALQNDNARYIGIAINFLGNMSMKEFQQKINSLNEIVKKYEPMLNLLPIHLREMIKKTPDKEIIKIFEQNCKDKFEWCKKEKKLSKITEMFNLLKEKI